MRKALYVGSQPKFRWKTALARDGKDKDHVLIQFDDRQLPEAFGWHEFLSADFDFGVEVEGRSYDEDPRGDSIP